MPSFEIPPLSAEVVSAFIFIFILRVIGISVSTVRVLLMMRGRRLSTALASFVETLLYVIAIGGVVQNLSNVWNVLAYSLGFVAGTMIGMWIDEKTATGYVNVRIVSRYKAQGIIEKIHESGYGATVGWGHGRGGTVGMILAIVRRREGPEIVRIAETLDPEVFITIEDARSVRRGYMHIARNQG